MDVFQSEVLDRLETDPEAFQRTFKVETVWEDATRVTMKVGRNELSINCGCENRFACANDPNHPPRPVEVALGGLSTCICVAYVAIATRMGIKVNSARVEVEGDFDAVPMNNIFDDSPAPFSGFRLNVFFDSEATDEQLKEIDKLVLLKSPVYHMFAGQSKVKVKRHPAGSGSF